MRTKLLSFLCVLMPLMLLAQPIKYNTFTTNSQAPVHSPGYIWSNSPTGVPVLALSPTVGESGVQVAAGTNVTTQTNGNVVTVNATEDSVNTNLLVAQSGTATNLTMLGGVGVFVTTGDMMTWNNANTLSPTNIFDVKSFNPIPAIISPPLIDAAGSQLSGIGTQNDGRYFLCFNAGIAMVSNNGAVLASNNSPWPQGLGANGGCGGKFYNNLCWGVNNHWIGTGQTNVSSNAVCVFDTNCNPVAVYGLGGPVTNTLEDFSIGPNGNAYFIPWAAGNQASIIYIFKTNQGPTWPLIGTLGLNYPIATAGGIVWNPYDAHFYANGVCWLYNNGGGSALDDGLYRFDLGGHVSPVGVIVPPPAPAGVSFYGGYSSPDLSTNSKSIVISANYYSTKLAQNTNSLLLYNLFGQTSALAVTGDGMVQANYLNLTPTNSQPHVQNQGVFEYSDLLGNLHLVPAANRAVYIDGGATGSLIATGGFICYNGVDAADIAVITGHLPSAVMPAALQWLATNNAYGLTNYQPTNMAAQGASDGQALFYSSTATPKGYYPSNVPTSSPAPIYYDGTIWTNGASQIGAKPGATLPNVSIGNSTNNTLAASTVTTTNLTLNGVAITNTPGPFYIITGEPVFYSNTTATTIYFAPNFSANGAIAGAANTKAEAILEPGVYQVKACYTYQENAIAAGTNLYVVPVLNETAVNILKWPAPSVGPIVYLGSFTNATADARFSYIFTNDAQTQSGGASNVNVQDWITVICRRQ